MKSTNVVVSVQTDDLESEIYEQVSDQLFKSIRPEVIKHIKDEVAKKLSAEINTKMDSLIDEAVKAMSVSDLKVWGGKTLSEAVSKKVEEYFARDWDKRTSKAEEALQSVIEKELGSQFKNQIEATLRAGKKGVYDAINGSIKKCVQEALANVTY